MQLYKIYFVYIFTKMTLEKKLQKILFLINQEKYKELIPKIHELLKEKYQSSSIVWKLRSSYCSKQKLPSKYLFKS